MNKRSQAWKALERETAKELGGKRVVRGDYGESDVDVKLDMAFLKVDCKYRQSHAHHSLLEGIRQKYCGPGERPVLVTKGRRQVGSCTTVDTTFFALLLDCLRVMERLQRADGQLFEDLANEVSANPNNLLTAFPVPSESTREWRSTYSASLNKPQDSQEEP